METTGNSNNPHLPALRMLSMYVGLAGVVLVVIGLIRHDQASSSLLAGEATDGLGQVMLGCGLVAAAALIWALYLVVAALIWQAGWAVGHRDGLAAGTAASTRDDA